MNDEEETILKHVQAVCATISGQKFIQYLFKHLDVGQIPDPGLPENLLRDQLGLMRAGTSIFKLVSAIEPTTAGKLLAEIEKERKHELREN